MHSTTLTLKKSLPKLYLLCGLPGSGKTTYAKKLESPDVIRLSLDEELFKKFGKNFSPDLYSKYEQATKDYLLENANSLFNKNKSIIFDWGFWKQEERKRITNMFKDRCAVSLMYFKTDKNTLIDRTIKRAKENNHLITEEMMEKFCEQFEEPGLNETFVIVSN